MSLSTGTILKRALERRKRAQAGISLRQVAKRLELSPSFLSGVMNDKKRLPIASLEPLARALDMDAVAVEKLKNSLVRETLPAPLRAAFRRELAESPHEELARPDYPLLSQWYFLAILDLTTCEGFKADHAWIANRLGISATQARQAWEILLHLGCLKKEEVRWKKRLAHIRFPTRSSEPAVRAYHAQTLRLAGEALRQTGAADFERRFIGGATVAVNPAHIAEAKLRIQNTLAEVATLLSQGSCTEVFQLQMQLFPLSRPEAT